MNGALRAWFRIGQGKSERGAQQREFDNEMLGVISVLFQNVCRSTDPGRSANIVVPMFFLLRLVSKLHVMRIPLLTTNSVYFLLELIS